MKRTKIVCTIGPASSSLATLRDMITAGMNIARFNFSHGSHDSNVTLLNTVRQAAVEAGQPVALLLDLQGPKVRIGELPKEGLTLSEGQTVTIQAGVKTSPPGTIPVPYERIASEIKPGDFILLADGTLELQVTGVAKTTITSTVILGGTLLSHKGINVPTISLVTESMTDKDEADLKFGLKQGIDFVALSFVRQASDVVELREKITQYLPTGLPTPAIIVKVEKPEALDNFDAILAEADGIMIARGDLGLETPISHVPLHQKEIIHKCLAAGKPVITATEMLGSMQFNPRPTRAEVSDVANAVFDHTDAVMLSGETAMGRYPTRAVQMMTDIIVAAENSPLQTPPLRTKTHASSPFAIADSVATLAQTLKAKAIIVTTQSGYFARAFARLRSPLPIIAAASTTATTQQLLLSWGITPLAAQEHASPDHILDQARPILTAHYGVKTGDPVIVVSGLAKSPDIFEHHISLTTL